MRPETGQRLVTCGIHKRIALVGYETAKITNFNLETLANEAKIRVEAYIEKASPNKQVKQTITGYESGEVGTSKRNTSTRMR